MLIPNGSRSGSWPSAWRRRPPHRWEPTGPWRRTSRPSGSSRGRHRTSASGSSRARHPMTPPAATIHAAAPLPVRRRAKLRASCAAVAAGSWREAGDTEMKLVRADRVFIVLELILIVALFVTLGAMSGKLLLGRYLLLWLLVLAGTLLPLLLQRRSSMGRPAFGVLAAFLVLLGGPALRMVVVFAAQA